jgi:protein-L-isoaspartate O-methyltransferase
MKMSLRHHKKKTRDNASMTLFIVSVASLFLELMLIRWISTEVRIFAYLQSSVLVVCLMGLGMGCFQSHAAIDLRRMFIPLGVIVALLSIPFTRYRLAAISEILATFGDFHIWFMNSEIVSPMLMVLMLLWALALTSMILFMVWVAFIPMGQMIGRLIEEHNSTVAGYSINVAGALVGITLFTLLSIIGTGPTTWFLVLALMLLFLATNYQLGRKLNLALALAIPLVVAVGQTTQLGDEVVWSPYQKLQYVTMTDTDPSNGHAYTRRRIYVNNTGYQEAFDLRLETINRTPEIFDQSMQGFSQYDLPLLFKHQPDKALIVGAGSGNDAAGALRNGAQHVTAVEIDPAIIELGKRHHPEAPYASEQVKIVNDDARSFFAFTKERYDLIVFGLLDSHTTGTMTNTRLDHYVYTNESISRARELLAPGGVMVLTFEANKPYIADRINTSLKRVFGTSPIVLRIPNTAYGWGGVMFVVGDTRVIQDALKNVPGLAAHVSRLQEASPVSFSGASEPTSDDWPYLYLEKRTIPPLYGFLTVIMLFIFFVSGRYVGLEKPISGWGRQELHFFFMGASFMLLEVMMIGKSAVALGSVWTVNAVIIGGILSMILVANWIKAKVPQIPMLPIYGLLLLSCAMLYFIDLSAIAHLPYAGRALAIAVVATIPMLFSSIVFIDSLDKVDNKSRALGANLFGALVGALLQSISFLTGIHFLVLLVGAGYLTAIALAPISQRLGVEVRWATK